MFCVGKSVVRWDSIVGDVYWWIGVYLLCISRRPYIPSLGQNVIQVTSWKSHIKIPPLYFWTASVQWNWDSYILEVAVVRAYRVGGNWNNLQLEEDPFFIKSGMGKVFFKVSSRTSTWSFIVKTRLKLTWPHLKSSTMVLGRTWFRISSTGGLFSPSTPFLDIPPIPGRTERAWRFPLQEPCEWPHPSVQVPHGSPHVLC